MHSLFHYYYSIESKTVPCQKTSLLFLLIILSLWPLQILLLCPVENKAVTILEIVNWHQAQKISVEWILVNTPICWQRWVDVVIWNILYNVQQQIPFYSAVHLFNKDVFLARYLFLKYPGIFQIWKFETFFKIFYHWPFGNLIYIWIWGYLAVSWWCIKKGMAGKLDFLFLNFHT